MESRKILEALLRAQLNVEELSGFKRGDTTPDDVYERNAPVCYEVDNNFAYKVDVYNANPTPANKQRAVADCKMFNFIPTYDRWCLWCDKRIDVTKRCSKCHSVFFCNIECQRKAWPIHKHHCGRNLFVRCAKCGKKLGGEAIECGQCPVVWCSHDCRAEMIQMHLEVDCEHLQKLF